MLLFCVVLCRLRCVMFDCMSAQNERNDHHVFHKVSPLCMFCYLKTKTIPRDLSSNTNTSINISTLDCSHTHPFGVAEEGGISTENLRASSDWNNETLSYSAEYGRLNGARAWCPNTTASQWLQVDLGAMYVVCGVATQGKAVGVPEWVTKYELSFFGNSFTRQVYSNNGTTVSIYAFFFSKTNSSSPFLLSK